VHLNNLNAPVLNVLSFPYFPSCSLVSSHPYLFYHIFPHLFLSFEQNPAHICKVVFCEYLRHNNSSVYSDEQYLAHRSQSCDIQILVYNIIRYNKHVHTGYITLNVHKLNSFCGTEVEWAT